MADVESLEDQEDMGEVSDEEQDLLQLHEDILEQNEEGVRKLMKEVYEEGTQSILGLIHKEAQIEPLAEDHPLNRIPLSALHRAALVGSTAILGLLIGIDNEVDRNLALTFKQYTPLHVAACAGVTPAVSYLAANGANLNQRDSGSKATAMHMAARKGHVDTAKILCVKGASCTVKDMDGRTALHVAAQEGHAKCVSFLLSKRVPVDCKDNEGRTALHLAQVKRKAEVTRLLLASGARVYATDAAGRSPLHLLAGSRDSGSDGKDIVDGPPSRTGGSNLDQLLQSGSNVNHTDASGVSPLHMAVQAQDITMVQHLLAAGAEINATDKRGQPCIFNCNNTSLFHELVCNDADLSLTSVASNTVCHHYAETDEVSGVMLSVAVQCGVEVNHRNCRGETALWCACERGRLDKVRVLLHSGADRTITDRSGRTVVHAALTRGHGDLARELLQDSDLKINSRDAAGTGMLHLAVRAKDQEAVICLLNHNADVNIVDVSGRTPTSIALDLKLMEILRLLLLHGSKLTNHPNSDVVFHFVKSDADVVDILLRQGVSFTCTDPSGQSPLHVALRCGAWPVSLLINERTDHIVDADQDSTSVLHVACQQDPPFAVLSRLLTKYKHCLNKKDNSGKTPLHYAMTKAVQDSQVVKLMVEMGASPGVEDNNTCTPVHLCCQQLPDLHGGSLLSAVDKLISCSKHSDFRVNSRDNHGRTCSHYIGMTKEERLGDTGIGLLKYILSMGSLDISDQVGRNALHYACESENIKMVELMVKDESARETSDHQGALPLHLAVRTGNVNLVETLLNHNVPVDKTDKTSRTALMVAVEMKFEDIVDMLLSKSADCNLGTSQSLMPLHVAASDGSRDVVQLLLDSHAKCDTQDSTGMTSLHKSVHNDDCGVLQMLVSAGADVHCADVSGDTALHLASRLDQYDHADILVDYGADLNARNQLGQTPLHAAALSPETDVMELLVANEADVNLADYDGCTPLQVATRLGYVEAALVLLERADLNRRDQLGETVLHTAARNQGLRRKPSFFNVLLKRGLSLNEENLQHQSAIDILKQENSEDTRRLLQQLSVDGEA